MAKKKAVKKAVKTEKIKRLQLAPLAFGYAGALISAALMLILGLLGSMGMALGAVNSCRMMYSYFSLSFTGILGGMAEAAIISFVLFYAFAWIYNNI